MPIKLNLTAFRDGQAPTLLRALVPATRRAAAGPDTGSDSLLSRLVRLPAGERLATVRDLVLTQVAEVLGHSSAELIDPDRAFKDLGFDSLTAVELRNQLSAATGARLSSTVVFDYPTATDLAAQLHDVLLGELAVHEPSTVHTVAHDEPIAIVGMACRYPGGVSTPEDLWRLVVDGGDGISPFPTNRSWDMDHWLAAVAAAGKEPQGGFVHDATDFDAGFFGISPNEAVMMEPQQRMLMEACWEAIERAGIDPASLKGSDTGVFVGVMQSDYDPGPFGTVEHNGLFRSSGALGSVVSGRVAYAFGLEGPAVSIDTACSSSLVALHWAIAALRQGECSLALAGGVSALVSPSPFAHFDTSGTAPDGRSKPFSARADGTGWAEGVGVLVVRRLSDALRDGDEVLAVIRSSAVNSDGASNGLTAPSGPAQERVIRRALAVAGLSPSDVDAVEASANGSTLGDPIEANALFAAYGQDRDRPLWLGSVKSNIGHTQAASGVAGVIKMVLALRHGQLPASRYADDPTPEVDWAASKVALLTETIPWPEHGRPRRAGVSSFGYSGTNAHLILEQAPVVQRAETAAPADDLPVPLLLSARTREALPLQAQRLRAYLTEHPELDPRDIGYSLALRSAARHRAVVVGTGRDELLRGLAALADTGGARPGAKTAFLFRDQTVRPGTGRDLHAAFPVFAQSFDEVSARFDDYLDRPLREVLFAGADSVTARLLRQPTFTHAALVALQVALFRLLESWGQRPDVVAGDGVGEVAAAHVAGVLSVKDAVKLAAHRGQLVQEMGDESWPEEFLDELGEIAEELSHDAPGIPILSATDLGPEHWVDACRRSARISRAGLEAAGVSRLVELGHATGEAPALLRDGHSEVASVLLAAGRLHVDGLTVNGARLFTGREARRVALPPYAFHRQRYWPDVDMDALRATGDLASTGLDATEHPLVGGAMRLADSDGVVLSGRISLATHPWLAGHSVDGRILLPGAAFVEIALRAGDEAGCRRIEELAIDAPLALPAHGKVRIQAAVGAPDESGARSLTVHSMPDAPDGGWTRHATGRLLPDAKADPGALTEWPPPGAEPVAVQGLYRDLAEDGVASGPALRVLSAAWRRDGEVFAEVVLGREASLLADRFGLHPVAMEAAALAAGRGVPVAWSGVELHATGATRLRVRVTTVNDDTVSVALADQAGEPVASVSSVVLATSQDLPSAAPVRTAARTLPARRTAARTARYDPGELRGTLAGLATDEQREVLLGLVREHTAALLGYPDAAAVDPGLHFLEVGFDSLTAIALRDRLGEALGLRLPGTIVFDQHSPAALAAHLLAELDRAAEPADEVKRVFIEAVLAGNVRDGLAALSSAATLRDTFSSSDDVGELPVPVRLADGPNRLLCLSSPAALGGVYQYARLAARFRGVREFSALPMPGFLPGQRLPASAGAVIDVLTRSVRTAVDGEPFALLGYSSAGVFAHAVAARLEQSGHGPAAVILVDTYAVDNQRDEALLGLASGMIEHEERYGPFDRAKLTAMARYLDLLPDVALPDIAAPTLLLRSRDPFADTAAGSGADSGADGAAWRTTWRRAGTVRTVPGNHFTLVEDDADTTAMAIEEWLGQALGAR